MLQRNYTPELVDFVKNLAEGEVLNKPTIDAIIIATEEHMGPLGITPYNVRQIVTMEDVDMNTYTEEVVAQNIIEKTYDGNSFMNTFKRVKEKDYIKKSRILGSVNDFLSHLETYLDGYTPKEKVKFIPRLNKKQSTKVIALTDLHLGNANNKAILNRLSEILESIINSSLTNVDVFCLGDLVETLVQGGMHDGQIEGMGDTYGFDLLLEVVETFEWFLNTITEHGIKVNFYGLSGNHDRMTKDRDGDRVRIGGLVIYELIKRGLSNNNGVSIHILKEYINTIDIDSIRYIVAHGDVANIPKRKGSDIAWNHGDNTKSHNVILYGHLHNVQITEEKSITKIGLPGLAGGDFYASKVLDLHSEPGYLEITHNNHGSIDFTIKRLTNE